MERITELDREITNLFHDFSKLAETIELPYICDLADEAKIASLSYPGINRIDVCSTGETGDFKPWVDEFRAEWEHVDYLKMHTANFKVKRIAKHKELREWMPLYLGKSKNVSKRVHEHLHLPLAVPTYALKINARPLSARRKFCLHALHVPVVNYDILATKLESSLRERFHPLIGKQ